MSGLKLLSPSTIEAIQRMPERLAADQADEALAFCAPMSLFQVPWGGVNAPGHALAMVGRQAMIGFARRQSEEFKLNDGLFHRFEEDENGRPVSLWSMEMTHWGTGRAGILICRQTLYISDGVVTGFTNDADYALLMKLAE